MIQWYYLSQQIILGDWQYHLSTSFRIGESYLINCVFVDLGPHDGSLCDSLVFLQSLERHNAEQIADFGTTSLGGVSMLTFTNRVTLGK